MPGPNAVGPSRVPQQPTAAPVAKQAPSLESRQDAAISEAFARTTTSRRSIPRYAGLVKSALGVARGSTSMAAAMLSDGVIDLMADRSPQELARNFQRAGISPEDAGPMAEAISQRVGTEMREVVRVRGHELIAERRAQLTQARDSILALQNAPEGSPSAAVYDALVERFGEEKIGQLLEHFDNGLEALDNWDRRLDGQVWRLGELGEEARLLCPAACVRGSIAEQQVMRGANEVERFAEEAHQGAEIAHLAFEVVEFCAALGHSAAHATGAGVGGVAGGAGMLAHHFAHEAHEDFIHGMQHLFEADR